MTTETSWKARLYDAYVSSGQVGTTRDRERLLASRAPYIRSVIRKYIPPNRSTRILDLGCGHGAFLYFLRLAGYQNIRGVDVSSEQIDLAHKLGIEEVERGEVVPFITTVENETVDIVLLMDVLEHLTRQELFDLLDEVFRVLRPGGKCIIHVPNAEGLYGMGVRYGDVTHEMAFSPKSTRQIFSAVGFHEVQCFEDKPIAHGIASLMRRLIWEMGTLWPRLLLLAETGRRSFVLSQNMIAIASKRQSNSE